MATDNLQRGGQLDVRQRRVLRVALRLIVLIAVLVGGCDRGMDRISRR